MSSNCLRQRCLRDGGIAAAPTPHSRNIKAKRTVEQNEDGDAENDGVVHRVVQVGCGLSCRLTFDTSGGAKGAQRPLERPLEAEVRRHSCALDSM